MKVFGLVGYPLSHSFSAELYARIWKAENNTSCRYLMFPIEDITSLIQLVNKKPELTGFNVTIPYKKSIIPFLDALTEEAKAIGAVNTVQIKKEGTKKRMIGHNTDVTGIRTTLDKLIRKHDKALIFGTGGAAVATGYILDKFKIPYTMATRGRSPNQINYSEINGETITKHRLLINCTPAGTAGNLTQLLPIPYTAINPDHVLFDLVYNPAVTPFMKEGLTRGAACINGYQMLVAQAEEAWKIWKG